MYQTVVVIMCVVYFETWNCTIFYLHHLTKVMIFCIFFSYFASSNTLDCSHSTFILPQPHDSLALRSQLRKNTPPTIPPRQFYLQPSTPCSYCSLTDIPWKFHVAISHPLPRTIFIPTTPSPVSPLLSLLFFDISSHYSPSYTFLLTSAFVPPSPRTR